MVWSILGAILVMVVIAWLFYALSDSAFYRAYDKAMMQDLDYYNAHPDCTYEEAHQNRKKVRRRFLRP